MVEHLSSPILAIAATLQAALRMAQAASKLLRYQAITLSPI